MGASKQRQAAAAKRKGTLGGNKTAPYTKKHRQNPTVARRHNSLNKQAHALVGEDVVRGTVVKGYRAKQLFPAHEREDRGDGTDF